MTRTVLVVALGLLAASTNADDARPKTCFYWIGDCVTKEGLSADIAALAEAGISEAYICAANMMNRPHSIGAKLLSPEWMDLFAHAVKEAKARGLKFGFHNCPGWSESGGPWITPENSMKYVVSATKDVRPGEPVGKLPQPRANLGFYRDLKTMAFPVDSTPAVVEVGYDAAGDATAFAREGSPLVLPLAKGPSAPVALTLRFARPFSPNAAILRFVDSNVNCAGTVEGSADGLRWTKLAAFDYHFHFVPSKSEKILTLDAREPIDRIRLTFRANEVPEWQGGKYVDRSLASVDFSSAPMIADVDAKSSVSTQFAYIPPRDPAAKGIARADWQVVDAKVQADGTLDWTAPARTDGKVWRVVRLGYTTTGKTCAPATLRGLECDKLSKRGLDAHWPNMPGKLLAVPGARDVLTSFYVDSWEASGQNWTEGFAEEFRKRRGYDLTPYLPVFAGFVVDDAGTTARALYDIQLTVADLIAENYFAYYSELCHREGVKASTEAYGGAYDSLRVAGLADLPTGELWIGGKYEDSLKMASSAAHVHGVRFTESETFTTEFAEGRWQITPHELKVWGDVAWLNGVNSIIYHSYAHQPVKAKPGISLGRHGTQLNRNSTWWPEMKYWSDYVRRGQELLRFGNPAADLLVVADEGRPNLWHGAKPPVVDDYHFDWTSAYDFRQMECRGKGVGLKEGATYPAVFLTGWYYSMSTLSKIEALAKVGVKIAGQRPVDTPTLADDVVAWRQARDRIWGKVVVETSDPRQALDRFGVKPSVESSPRLASIRREGADGTRVFFVVNRTKKPFKGPVAFAAVGAGEIRNCVDGTSTPFDGTLDLPPNGSAFVVFGPRVVAGRGVLPTQDTFFDLSTDWTITSFSGLSAPAAPLRLSKLIDWTTSTDQNLKYFSGRATYEKTIDLSSHIPHSSFLLPPSSSLTLDLGEVHDIVNVFVNDKFIACLWEPPYRVTLSPQLFNPLTLKPFNLKLELVNTLPNRLIGDAILRANGAAEPKGEAGWPRWVLENREDSGTGLSTWSNFGWAWTATDALRPAGLLGPVRIGLKRGVSPE